MRRRLCRFVVLAGLLPVFVPGPTRAEEAPAIAALEREAMASLVAGQYGVADEKIRAAIALADEESFNRLALLQGLIALRLGSDGRSLMGAAIAAHESNAWPRPVIAYLLGERKLQEVADGIRRSGHPFEVKRQQICELSFYAGAFAASDGETRFARQLFQKAIGACDRGSPVGAMTVAELASLDSGN
jgi:hypothetical protein